MHLAFLGSRDLGDAPFQTLYFRLVGGAKMKQCTNLELFIFTGFRDILEGMQKILGVI